jgi:hypothetical protein
MIRKLKRAIKNGQQRIRHIVTFNRKRHATIKRLEHEHHAITMYDSVTVGEIPPDAEAVAGYVDGIYRTFTALTHLFPHAWRLSIAVFSLDRAACLDVENGDATPQEAPGWVLDRHKEGVRYPKVYASVSQMDYIVELLRMVGVKRDTVKLWTAHYGKGKHICSPHSCGELKNTADGTQYDDKALNRNLDVSLLHRNFFQ